MRVRLKFGVFSVIFWSYLTAGLWNWFLGGGLLAGWKQGLAVVAYLLAASVIRTKADYTLFWGSLLLLALLSANATLGGQGLPAIIFNDFFYFTWVPFFILAKHGFASAFVLKYRLQLLGYLLICAAGLLVELKTDYLGFLSGWDSDNAYLEKVGAAKRCAFIFTASTLVMPVLGAVFVLYAYANPKPYQLYLALGGCLVAVLCTGSLGAAIIFVAMAAGYFIRDDFRKNKRSALKVSFTLVVILCGSILLRFDNFQGQLERISGNDYQSESNLGRLGSWDRALDRIYAFSVREHFLGLGVGATVGKMSESAISHGESSFLQAYLEGGVVGALVRALPFLMFFLGGKRSGAAYGYILGYLVNVAVAPIFGNLPSQALLGILVGLGYMQTRKVRI